MDNMFRLLCFAGVLPVLFAATLSDKMICHSNGGQDLFNRTDVCRMMKERWNGTECFGHVDSWCPLYMIITRPTTLNTGLIRCFLYADNLALKVNASQWIAVTFKDSLNISTHFTFFFGGHLSDRKWMQVKAEGNVSGLTCLQTASELAVHWTMSTDNMTADPVTVWLGRGPFDESMNFYHKDMTGYFYVPSTTIYINAMEENETTADVSRQVIAVGNLSEYDQWWNSNFADVTEKPVWLLNQTGEIRIGGPSRLRSVLLAMAIILAIAIAFVLTIAGYLICSKRSAEPLKPDLLSVKRIDDKPTVVKHADSGSESEDSNVTTSMGGDIDSTEFFSQTIPLEIPRL